MGENIDAGNRLEAVFFRSVNLPNGAVPVRRHQRKLVQALGRLIDAAPRDAELYLAARPRSRSSSSISPRLRRIGKSTSSWRRIAERRASPRRFLPSPLKAARRVWRAGDRRR
jgi:hypothetical protein